MPRFARFSSRVRRTALLLLCVLASLMPAMAGAVDRVAKDQRQAVEQFLGAVASGEPQAIAYAIHPADIEALRTRLLNLMREEAKKGDFTIRSRLFGQAMPLADLERLTAPLFFASLFRKLYITARDYRDADYIGAVPDRDGLVHVLLWGRQPKERGDVKVLNVVTIKPYGADWKAAMPSELEAQIDDLIHGRRSRTMVGPRLADGPAPASGSGSATTEAFTPPEITEMLEAVENALVEGKCDVYYREYMSPNFRRVTSKKAMEDLIAACQNSLGTREMLLSTIRLVRSLHPRLTYEGQRAVYDLSGAGLPYERFSLEQVKKRWYIAE